MLKMAIPDRNFQHFFKIKYNLQSNLPNKIIILKIKLEEQLFQPPKRFLCIVQPKKILSNESSKISASRNCGCRSGQRDDQWL